MNLIEVSLDDIDIGPRIRRDFGDIEALAASIAEIGLLHPVVLTDGYDLISGHRRILAFRSLGRETIPARLIDIDSIVLGEYAENEIRKDFTPSERCAIAMQVEKEIGNRQGQRTDQLPRNCAEVKGEETRDIAAEKAGLKRDTFRRIKSTLHTGIPELVAAMDAGDLAPSVTAKLAVLPKDEQRRLAADKEQAIAAAKLIPSGITPEEHDPYAWSFNFADCRCVSDQSKFMAFLKRVGKTPADFNWDPKTNGPIDVTKTHSYRKKHGVQPQKKTTGNSITLSADPEIVARRIIALCGEDKARKIFSIGLRMTGNV